MDKFYFQGHIWNLKYALGVGTFEIPKNNKYREIIK